MLMLIACLTMLIDHIGAVFFPDMIILRIIGRISMPLYAYSIAQGYIHTHDRKAYYKRIAIIAMLSQIPYMLTFSTYNLNVCFTWLFGLIWLHLLEIKDETKYVKIICLTALAGITCIIPTDYNAYGIILIPLFYIAEQMKQHKIPVARTAILIFALGVMPLPLMPEILAYYQPFAILAVPFIYIAEKFDFVRPKNKSAKYIYRYFYPAHLAILAAINICMLLYANPA